MTKVLVVVVMEVMEVVVMAVVVVMGAHGEGMCAHAHGGLRLMFRITFFHLIP